jgi:hypothetical protein
MRIKMSRFDLVDGGFHQATEFFALVVGNAGFQILDFRKLLANKHNEGTSEMPVSQE